MTTLKTNEIKVLEFKKKKKERRLLKHVKVQEFNL